MTKPTRPQQPPVYRPQPTPKVLQPKSTPAAQAGRTPNAPPPYRPQTAPKCLQTKAATPLLTRQHAPHARGQQPAPKVLQPKSATPHPARPLNTQNAPPKSRHAQSAAHNRAPRDTARVLRPEPNAARPGVVQRHASRTHAPVAPCAPVRPAAHPGVVQLMKDKVKNVKSGEKRKKEFKKTIDPGESKKKREEMVVKRRRRTKDVIVKQKRMESLKTRREIEFKPSVHPMLLRYPHRENTIRLPLDEDVLKKYVLLALDNFVKIVGDAKKFVGKTQVVKAKPLDETAFSVNAKFATKKSPFPLLNCVAVSERPDGVSVVSSNSTLSGDARGQLDKLFPKKFVMLEPRNSLLAGLHCEIKLWEEVDNFEDNPYGVQQLCCLYCAAQLVAAGVKNFLGCHGQTYDHTHISPVLIGQPNACRKLLGQRVYEWYRKLKTDEQYQFVAALECGGFIQRTNKIKPTKLGSMSYSDEAKVIHKVEGTPMKNRVFFEEHEEFKPVKPYTPPGVDTISFIYLEEVYDITPQQARTLGVKGQFTDSDGVLYMISFIDEVEQEIGIVRLG